MPNNIAPFCGKHRIIGLDTMLFIYQFEKYKNYWRKTEIIFDLLEKGKFKVSSFSYNVPKGVQRNVPIW